MIKAWTYNLASEGYKYWLGCHSIPIILVEEDGALPTFRKVSDGEPTTDGGTTRHYEWKQKPLPREWWPQWLLEKDDMFIDEGL